MAMNHAACGKFPFGRVRFPLAFHSPTSEHGFFREVGYVSELFPQHLLKTGIACHNVANQYISPKKR